MDNQNNGTGDDNFISDEVLNDLSNQNDQGDDQGLVPAPQTQDQNDSNDQTDQNQVPTAHEILANKQKEESEDNQPDDVKDQDKPHTSAKALGNGNGDDQELLDIKKQALENLSPLVDKLDLVEEQRFETIMEILQASDDRTLVKPALEAAEAIKDESNRAQALLDVVNEVNYLTQDEKQK